MALAGSMVLCIPRSIVHSDTLPEELSEAWVFFAPLRLLGASGAFWPLEPVNAYRAELGNSNLLCSFPDVRCRLRRFGHEGELVAALARLGVNVPLLLEVTMDEEEGRLVGSPASEYELTSGPCWYGGSGGQLGWLGAENAPASSAAAISELLRPRNALVEAAAMASQLVTVVSRHVQPVWDLETLSELTPLLLGIGLCGPIKLPSSAAGLENPVAKELWRVYFSRPLVHSNLRNLWTALSPSTSQLLRLLIAEGSVVNPSPNYLPELAAPLLDLRGLLPDSRFWLPPSNPLAFPVFPDGSRSSAAPNVLLLKPSLAWLTRVSGRFPTSKTEWLEQLLHDLKAGQHLALSSGQEALVDEAELSAQVL